MSDETTTETTETTEAVEAQGFDLAAAKPVAEREEEGREVHVRGADDTPLYYAHDGERKPVTMRVAGTYSARYRRTEEALRDKRLKRGRYTGEQAERDTLRLHAACVISWNGFFDAGKPIPCTDANVLTVLRAARWIDEQVNLAMNDHEGFSEPSSGG
jgi:hypothetical protein